MDKDDDEEDVAEDTDNGDDRVDATIKHLVNKQVNLWITVVTRTVQQHCDDKWPMPVFSLLFAIQFSTI